jgi:hypothetical protein
MSVVVVLDVFEEARLLEGLADGGAPLLRYIDDMKTQWVHVAAFHRPVEAKGLADDGGIGRIVTISDE